MSQESKKQIPGSIFLPWNVNFLWIWLKSPLQNVSGAAVKSLLITIMRNIILFIPAATILNTLWQLDGVIAAQPIVETFLAIICIVMYIKDSSAKKLEPLDNLSDLQ